MWWKAFQAATPNLLDSVPRPSQYDVAWDGKTDAGKVVGQGAYFIHIEASREHGGHSYREIPIRLGADRVKSASAGGGELGATNVSYGKN